MLDRVSDHTAVHSARDSGATLQLVMQAARRRDFDVSTKPYIDGRPEAGTCTTELLINGKVCRVQTVTNAQPRPGKRQVYANTGLTWSSLIKHDVTIFFVRTPGYRRMTLIVPSYDFIKAFYADRSKNRVSIYIPLESRPENPIFDFWHYKNNWSAFD